MSVGAILTVVILNNRGQDAKAAATMDSTAIDITQDLAGMDLTLALAPPAPDATTVASPGHIQRVVRVMFGPTWADTYPEPAFNRATALNTFLSNILAQRVPAVIDSQTVVLF